MEFVKEPSLIGTISNCFFLLLLLKAKSMFHEYSFTNNETIPLELTHNVIYAN